jgi:hypothetical protein
MFHPLQSMLGPDHSRPSGWSQEFDFFEQIMNNYRDMESVIIAEALAQKLWRCFD